MRLMCFPNHVIYRKMGISSQKWCYSLCGLEDDHNSSACWRSWAPSCSTAGEKEELVVPCGGERYRAGFRVTEMAKLEKLLLCLCFKSFL